jgi:hypothetical protein
LEQNRPANWSGGLLLQNSIGVQVICSPSGGFQLTIGHLPGTKKRNPSDRATGFDQ